MKYAKLGNSELKVSRICMGCMGFGDAQHGQHSWTLDEGHSREIIKRGIELGVNFFDTAIAYQSGTSEQYLGRRPPGGRSGGNQVPAPHARGDRIWRQRPGAHPKDD